MLVVLRWFKGVERQDKECLNQRDLSRFACTNSTVYRWIQRGQQVQVDGGNLARHLVQTPRNSIWVAVKDRQVP